MQILSDLPGDTSGETSSESCPSPQTPLDADEHFLHAAMNQPIVQNSLYAQNYSLQSDSDCLDTLGQSAGIAYSHGGVSDSPRRDAEFKPQVSTLSGTLGHRSSANDPAFHLQPDPSSGSISTSPSSNNSSATYSFAGTQRPQYHNSQLTLPNIAHNPFPNAQPVTNTSISSTFNLPTTFGGMQARPSEHTTTFLPSHRSGVSSSNPVSPNGGTSARERYANLPGHGRYYQATTAGAQNDIYPRPGYLYGQGEHNRLLTSNVNMSTTSSSYTSQTSTGDTPPFSDQVTLHEIYGGSNEVVKPTIEAKIEKGFFLSGDGCWTCYRRNYFAVQCSYSLTPHLSNQTLYIQHKGDQRQIQAMAVSLSARVDGQNGKPIELVQHTPKRDKGPQNPVKITRLCPIPPGGKLGHLPHAEHPYPMMAFGNTPNHISPPYFPLQSQADPDPEPQDPANALQNPATLPTAHQHTFERIQFKNATANNGKRRAQQQYYHLIIELHADVRSPNSPVPNWVKVAERSSSQVVVRGRSPSHYSNEGPNSTASRPGGGAAGGGSGFHGLGMGYSMGLTSSIARTMGGYSLGGSAYRGNTYAMEPPTLASYSVSSAPSLNGAHVDGYSMDHQSPPILSSQGGPAFMPATSMGNLPPIFDRVKDEYYAPTQQRIPTLEVGTRSYGDAAVY